MDSFLKKRVLVIFDDNASGGRRVGILTSIDNNFIVLDSKESIPIARIIRIELSGGGLND